MNDVNKAEVYLSSLQRFDPNIDITGCEDVPVMESDYEGQWVKLSDVKALLATPPATTGCAEARHTGGANATPTGASTAFMPTVLTDERIWDIQSHYLGEDGQIDDVIGLVRHVEREVVAQAGQVAVPEGFVLMPIEPTDAMMDAPEVKVGGCYSCSPEQVGWHDCAEIYRLMVAAAPSPAKESK